MDAYVFVKEIAKGGVGTVYEVSKNNEIYAAKKVLYKDLFVPEVDILKRNKHPNIAKAIDIQYDETSVYFIMKKYPKTLKEYLNDRELTEEEWIKIAYQLASALAYLHDLGYYHCDIKENNVMIDEEGNAILIDFSVAYSVHVPYNDNTCSSTPYQPPERLKQIVKSHFPSLYINYQKLNISPYISPRNDVWAYGALLVYMKTQRYFFGTSATSLIQNSLKFIINPTDYVEKKIGGTGFDEMFHKIFTKEPNGYTFADILQEDVFSSFSPIAYEPITNENIKQMVGPSVYKITRWILELAHTYRCTLRTYVYATNLFLRALPTTENYQLLGAVCLAVYVNMFENGGECSFEFESIKNVCAEHSQMYMLFGRLVKEYDLDPPSEKKSTEEYIKQVIGIETDDVFTCAYDTFVNYPIPSGILTIPVIPSTVEGSVNEMLLGF